jgi:chromosome segregation ATPase
MTYESENTGARDANCDSRQNGKGDSRNSTAEDDLKRKQAELNAAKEQVAKSNAHISELQGVIKSLEAMISDVKNAAADYGKTYPAMERQCRELKADIAHAMLTAKAEIEDTKPIEDTIKSFDDRLKAKETEVDKLGEGSATAQAEAAEADATALQTKAGFEAMKKCAKAVEAAIKEVTELKKKADDAETRKDYIEMYFYASEANTRFDNISLPLPSVYEDRLRKRLGEVEIVTDTAAKKKAAAKSSADSYETKKKEYEAARAARRADLVEKLKSPCGGGGTARQSSG